MKINLSFVLKILWVILCALFLVSFFNHPNAWDNPEVSVLFVLKMQVVTFPSGVIVWSIFSAKSILFPGSLIVNQEIDFIVRWICFVCVGYIQWFILLPWIINKVTKKKRP